MANVNDMHRAVRDVGTSVIDILKVQISHAATDLSLSDIQISQIMDIIDIGGKQALEGSFKNYFSCFETYDKTKKVMKHKK